MTIQIKKAERKSVKIKLAITGPSGAGKTMGSLLLAKGLAAGGKVLIIDSEDGSSNLYADHKLVGMDFDVIELDAPYTVTKYLQALQAGQDAGYDVIVIDSITHAWAGEGGLLDKKTSLDSRGGNSFTNWASITKEQEQFKAKIIHSSSHVIVTMRSKQEYVVEANDKGRSAPKKVGLAPIQRDGMEYEFTTVFDVSMDHSYQASKDRTGLFDGRIEKLGESTGKEIRDWLNSGAVIVAQSSSVAEEIDAPAIHRSIIQIKSQNDMLAAVEFWGGITASEKEAVKKLMTPGEISWFKQAWEGRPKEASQAVNTQYPLHS